MRKNLIHGTMVLTISSIIFLISGYLINLWLGRHLGPETYGVYGIIISLMTVVNIIQTSGLPQATSKFIAEDHVGPDIILLPAFYLQLISTLFLTIIFMILANPLALLLKDQSLADYIKLSALILPFYGIFSLYSGYYNGLHSFKKQAVMSIVYSFVKVLGVVGFVLLFQLRGAILGFIVAPIIALFFGSHWPKATIAFPYKKLIYYSLPLIGFAVLSTLPISLDLFFVKYILRDNHLTGLYNAAGNIADIPFFALSSFAVVLFPSISQLTSQNNLSEAKITVENALRVVLIILIPACALLSAGSRGVLSLLYSNAYLGASQPLSVLAFGIGFLTLFSILASVLNGAGQARQSLFYALAGIIVSATACLVLIPKMGITGAAWSTTAGSFISFYFAYRSVHRSLGAGFKLQTILKVGVLSSLIYLVVNKNILPVMTLPFFYLGLFTVYLFLLYLIKEISEDDLLLIKKLIPSWVPYLGYDKEI